MAEYNLTEKIRPLEALIIDVDGVLTPGGIWYSDEGDQLKRFDVKDGLGLVALGELGMKLGIITGKTSKILEKRASELRVDALFQNRPNKIPTYRELRDSWELRDEQIAMAGDDVIDIPLFDVCGFSVSPADGAPAARRAADWVTRAPGGKGALREICEIIISAKTGIYPPDEFLMKWTRNLPKNR